jgi:DNA processing protein
MDQHAFWVGFNHVRGIGAVRMRILLNHFGNLETAWQAPADILASINLPPKVIENCLRIRKTLDLDALMARLEKQSVTVLTWEDAGYPSLLKEIDQPPPVLYVRGKITEQDAVAVAVVGTRRITSYGKQVAGDLATYLGSHKVTVVSGLARGVDALAHTWALKAGGRTLAVLGSGIDIIYPPEHARLAEEIIQQGAVITDYPPGTQPDAVNFPPRNRIISGLSLATVVVEAGETSGALITASFAAEQGREVLAVPGHILAPQSRGTNLLIQNGARPLLRMSDVLEVLDIKQIGQQQEARKVLPVDALEARILQILVLEPLHIDELCVQLGMPIEKVSATLAIMELKGLTNQVSPMSYTATREASEVYEVD